MRYITIAQSPKTKKFAVVSMKGQKDLFIVGHCEADTKEEVLEMYRQYLLERYTMYTSDDEQRKCEVCGKWTSTYATIDQFGKHFWLCSEHANDDEVDRLFQIPPDFAIWES